MSELSNKEKEKLIRDLCNKHDITAYEIGENTSVSGVAAHNILTSNTKNPRGKTLNTILNYIEEKIVGKDVPGEKNYLKSRMVKNNVNEKAEKYNNSTAEVLSAIDQLRKMIRRDNDLMSKALEISLLDTQEIKSLSSIIRDKTNTIDSSINGLSSIINKRLGSGS